MERESFESEEPIGQAAEGDSARAELAQRLKEILALTNELFGGPSALLVEADPGVPDSDALVISAVTQLSSLDAMHARLAWHERVSALIGRPHNLRLAVEFD